MKQILYDDKSAWMCDGPVLRMTYYRFFKPNKDQTLRDILNDLDGLFIHETDGYTPLVKCDHAVAEYALNEDRVREVELHLCETKRVAKERPHE